MIEGQDTGDGRMEGQRNRAQAMDGWTRVRDGWMERAPCRWTTEGWGSRHRGAGLKGQSSRDGWTEGSRWAWPSQREVFPFTTPSSSQLDGCAQIHVADPAPRGLGAAGPPGSPVQELPVLPAPAVPELLRVHPSHAVKV